MLSGKLKGCIDLAFFWLFSSNRNSLCPTVTEHQFFSLFCLQSIPSRCTWAAGLHFTVLVTTLDMDVSCSPGRNSSLHPRVTQLDLPSWHVRLEWDSPSCPTILTKEIDREDIVFLVSMPLVGGSLDSLELFVWFLKFHMH
jgi:hypothetical protein